MKHSTLSTESDESSSNRNNNAFKKHRFGLLALIMLMISVIGFSIVQAATVTVTITSDNAYVYGFGDYYGITDYHSPGVCNTSAGEIYSNGTGPENYSFTGDLSGKYIYIVAWSDEAVFQGTIAQFSDGNTTIMTGPILPYTEPQWKVYATGIDLDPLSDGVPLPHGNANCPTLIAVNNQIVIANNDLGLANTSVGWVGTSQTSGRIGVIAFGYNNSIGPVSHCNAPTHFPPGQVQGIDGSAQWMWYKPDTSITYPFETGSIPCFPSAQSREYYIFRVGPLDSLFSSTDTICGKKIWDKNCNGIYDAGDVGLPGWTIQLEIDTGVYMTTITDANGNYCFNNLPEGTYIVHEVQQSGYFPKNPASGEFSVILDSSHHSVYNLYFLNCKDTIPNQGGLDECPEIIGKRYNAWYFGRYAGISFNTGMPTYINGSAMYANEGSASIADFYTGNALFYTNGERIWNSNNVEITSSGNTMYGGQWSSKQSSLIIPKPNSTTNYYIFTTPEPFTPIYKYLYYTEVNVTASTTSIVTLNHILYDGSRTNEKITAACDSLGENIWVISHTVAKDTFLFSKININTGAVTFDHKQNIGQMGSNNSDDQWNAVGEMKVSPDGKMLAVTTPYNGDLVELYDFYGSTGMLGNYRSYHIVNSPTPTPKPFPIEFSPDSKFLYVGYTVNSQTEIVQPALVQFDIYPFPAPSSATTIINQVPNWNDGVWALQLAPDGKIYCGGRSRESLYVINNPNVAGASCNFTLGMTLPVVNGTVHCLPNIAYLCCVPPPPPPSDTICGKKIWDKNCNGIYDSGDIGLDGWTIQLEIDTGVYMTTITDANGNYCFYNVPEGTYIVQEVQQSGYSPSNPASGEFSVILDSSHHSVYNLYFLNCKDSSSTPSNDSCCDHLDILPLDFPTGNLNGHKYIITNTKIYYSPICSIKIIPNPTLTYYAQGGDLFVDNNYDYLDFAPQYLDIVLTSSYNPAYQQVSFWWGFDNHEPLTEIITIKVIHCDGATCTFYDTLKPVIPALIHGIVINDKISDSLFAVSLRLKGNDKLKEAVKYIYIFLLDTNSTLFAAGGDPPDKIYQKKWLTSNFKVSKALFVLNNPVILKAGELSAYVANLVWKGGTRNNLMKVQLYNAKGDPLAYDSTVISSSTDVQAVDRGMKGDEFELLQSVPNPTDGNTSIYYIIGSESEIKLILYNSLGEQVMTINEGFKTQGIHTLDLNTSGLISGSYYLKLVGQGRSTTLPIMIVK